MLQEAISTIREFTRGGPYEGKLFLVGGLVRDRLLRLPPEQDIDIVCLADALAVARSIAQAGLTDHAPVVFERFGTAMVTVSGIQVEFATARRESYAPDSRKPASVQMATLEEDAQRRDFTVNTLMEHLHTGELLDLTGRGRRDIVHRIIRTPLDPHETFRDDPLRMLRAVRFAARLEFRIEKATERAIRECAGRLQIVSLERIRDELCRLMMARRASHGLQVLLDTGLLQHFAPDLAAMAGVEQNVYHMYDVWTHTLKALDALPPYAGLEERLAMLLHDIGKPGTRTVDEEGNVHFYGHQQLGAETAGALLHELKFPNDVIARVVRLVDRHMRIGEYSPDWTDTAVRRLVRDLGDDMDALFTISDADKAACNPEYHYLDSSVVRDRIGEVQAEADYAHIQSPLDGREIMSIAGIGPGPRVGELKEYLVSEMLEGRLAEGDRETAERLLRARLERTDWRRIVAGKTAKGRSGPPTIENRRARHDYFIEDSFEAGIELKGAEVKSLRQGNANLQDAYVQVQDGELWVHGMFIRPYEQANRWAPEERRARRLLAHKNDILRLRQKAQEKGLTLIPLKVYFTRGWAKMEVGIARARSSMTSARQSRNVTSSAR